jgi:hypothetical protein
MFCLTARFRSLESLLRVSGASKLILVLGLTVPALSSTELSSALSVLYWMRA